MEPRRPGNLPQGLCPCRALGLTHFPLTGAQLRSELDCSTWRPHGLSQGPRPPRLSSGHFPPHTAALLVSSWSVSSPSMQAQSLG
jgi:hypothetical protein